TLASNVITNLNLSDVWTCYKAFRREVFATMELRENRFGFEQEITAKIARKRLRIYEVPISYFGRTYAEGKKITWKDGFRGIWCVLRYGLFDYRREERAAAVGLPPDLNPGDQAQHREGCKAVVRALRYEISSTGI